MHEVRLDRIFREVKELVPVEGIELLTPSVVHGVVPQSTLDMRPQHAFREGYAVAPAQPNDFVISLSSHAHGIEWCGIHGGISPDYTLLRPTVDSRYARYLRYALKSQYIISQLGVFKTGVRMGLRLQWNKVRYCKIELPSVEESVMLADYLDRATSRIDTLIAKKARFIELLREKRQALITRAVTKGLDAAAQMKDSGVEWLGQVPSKWTVLPLKRDVAFITSGSRGWAEHYSERGALFLRIGNLRRGDFRLDLSDVQRVVPPAGSEGVRTKVRPGDLLFSITAYLGSVSVAPDDLGDAYVSQHVALVRLAGRLLTPSWAAYVALSWVGSTYLLSQGYGGTKVQLALEDVLGMPVTVPPLDEQIAIVAHLQRATFRIDRLITRTERSIELLRERRTALIAAAVTGKLDVLGAALTTT